MIKIGFYFHAFNTANNGQGHVTRAMAIKKALERQGVFSDRAEMHFIGQPDAPEVWLQHNAPHTLHMLDKPFKRPEEGMPIDKASEIWLRLFRDLSDLVASVEVDLLLIDLYFSPLKDLLYSDKRPKAVWGICRKKSHMEYWPKLLDRLYLIERFPLPDYQFGGGIARERCKSLAEKEAIERGEYFPVYRTYNPSVDASFQAWQKRYHYADRKLIAPVVDISQEEILPRETARATLCQKFNLDPDKPIAMAIARTRNYYQSDIDRLETHLQTEILPKGYQLIKAGGKLNDGSKDDNGYSYIPNVMQYVSGVDHVISHTGYNTFYSLRYLQQLGLYNGSVSFVPMQDSANDDQLWRYQNAFEKVLPDGSWHAGLFSNAPEYATPTGNGADYLATAIVNKFNLGN